MKLIALRLLSFTMISLTIIAINHSGNRAYWPFNEHHDENNCKLFGSLLLLMFIWKWPRDKSYMHVKWNYSWTYIFQHSHRLIKSHAWTIDAVVSYSNWDHRLRLYYNANPRWWAVPWWRHQKETFSALLAFCAGIHRFPVNFPHKGQCRGAFMFSLICAWINRWVNNREAGDLRRYYAHCDVIVMKLIALRLLSLPWYHCLTIIAINHAGNRAYWPFNEHIDGNIWKLFGSLQLQIFIWKLPPIKSCMHVKWNDIYIYIYMYMYMYIYIYIYIYI